MNRRADLVFSRARIAVFLDGCFWHGCPQHLRLPASNAVYWSSKISGNVDRDQEVDVRLRELDWTVLRFWEHENPVQIARTIIDTVRSAAAPTNPSRSGDDPRLG